jgi:Zn-dependent protease with chaperone function
MDFFSQQDNARRQTGFLVAYLSGVVIMTILLVYFLPLLLFRTTWSLEQPFRWWYPQLFFSICGITLLVVVCGSLHRIGQLRYNGGEGIARLLGGQPIHTGTTDFFEQRLRNVVEEMAIASGVSIPDVYILPRELGINAFAAGHTQETAVIAVTYGAMTGLTREELQGVIAHEFSHLLNGDVRLNTSLIGILHGLLLISLIGHFLIARASDRPDRGTFPLFFGGILLIIVGSIGHLGAKIIKAAISRSREQLADASAVQFTRNPLGLGNALIKIGGLETGSRIQSPHAEQASHMFFSQAMRSSIFDSHPPLVQRIGWLLPHFDGQFPTVTLEKLQHYLQQKEKAPAAKRPDLTDLLTDPIKMATAAAILGDAAPPKPRTQKANQPRQPEQLLETIGAPMQQHAEHARALIDSIPSAIRNQTTDPFGAQAIVYLLLLDSDPAIQNRQLEALEAAIDAPTKRAMNEIWRASDAIQSEQRLPLLELTLPALRQLSELQYSTFRHLIKVLADADQQMSLFEYCLQRLVIRNLDAHFFEQKKEPVNYYNIRGLQDETSTILSVLARVGTQQRSGH